MGKVLLALMLCLLPFASVSAGGKDDAKAEVAQSERLMQAQKLVDEKRPEDAISLLDQILTHYAQKYPEGDTRWYVARGQAETLAYLVHTAAEQDRGEATPQNARVVQGAWADAYFLKGYALVELARNAEAKDALEHAIRLSPYNSNYSAELGHIYQLEQNWDKAYVLFSNAEDAAAFSSPEKKITETTRAKRGLAYALIEMDRLPEAETELKECLKLDKRDKRAEQELEYLRGLRKSKEGKASR